jgi:hypothetical protein
MELRSSLFCNFILQIEQQTLSVRKEERGKRSAVSSNLVVKTLASEMCTQHRSVIHWETLSICKALLPDILSCFCVLASLVLGPSVHFLTLQLE